MMFEGEHVSIWIERNILFLKYRDSLVLTPKVAQEIVRSRLIIQHNQEYAVLCDTSGIFCAHLEALNYLSQDGLQLIKVVAYYADSPLNVLLTQFFLETHRKNIPAEIFNHKHQAINFLLKHSK